MEKIAEGRAPMNVENVHKLSPYNRKLLEQVMIPLKKVNLNYVNNPIGIKQIHFENLDEYAVSILITKKEEQKPVIEIFSGRGECYLRVDGNNLYHDDQFPMEEFYVESINNLCDVLEKVLNGITIIDYFDKAKNLKKKVYYWGFDKEKKKIFTASPNFTSFLKFTDSKIERKYIFL